MNFKLLSGLFSAFVCFFALADAAPAVNTGGKVVVGYRVTGSAEAEAWKKNGNRPYWDSKKSSGRQLGAGIYLTDINGGWPMRGPDTRFCVVLANKDKFEELKKVWFPNMLESRENPELRTNALAYKECDLDRNIYDTYGLPPRETLRVSDLYRGPPGSPLVKQVLLPAEIVNATSSDLDLRSMCSDTPEGLTPRWTVNFDEWDLLGT